MRWGIAAIVGESFAEIFFGNCISLGIPCATVDVATIARLMDAAESKPSEEWVLDLETQTLQGAISAMVSLPDGPRKQFLTGRWNALNELLTNSSAIDEVANRLPYVSGW